MAYSTALSKTLTVKTLSGQTAGDKPDRRIDVYGGKDLEKRRVWKWELKCHENSQQMSFYPSYCICLQPCFISDSHLTFTNQVSSVSRAYFYHIRDLRRTHLNTQLFPPHISSTSLLLNVTWTISSKSSLLHPLNPSTLVNSLPSTSGAAIPLPNQLGGLGEHCKLP